MQRKVNKILSIVNGVAFVDVSTKKHQNLVAMIDEIDLDIILKSPRRWYASRNKNGEPSYVGRNLGSAKNKDQRTELLHRVLLGLAEGDELQGDHKDRNPLNNKRSNLRRATICQNARNKTSQKKSTSKYLGVWWCKQDKCWYVRRTVDKQIRHLGAFKSEVLAALAYDEDAKHDPFANLNFKDMERR